ncbi:MAG: hypothetical protein HY868_25545 [Chloroflexi bacterium]|nr:hypothetical protein [Chloroflexota bacterium]
MLDLRNVERSLYEHVKGLLTAPTGGLPVPYNVYGEDAYTNSSFAPVFPYVWMLGFRVRPRKSRLPLIIVDVGNTRHSPFEMGNRNGAMAFAQLNIFANTRGERDDLAAYLLKQVENVPVYDYTPATPTFLWNAELLDKLSQRNSIGEDAGKEGSLTNWMTVAYGFQLKE